MSYICKINDKSLLRDFEQLKASTIPYHVEFKGNTNIFGVVREEGGYPYPSYNSRVDELTEIKGSGLPFAFIKYDENESGFTLNSGHYSQVVPFFHELRHAALYDAIVRYIELDENVSLDLIKDAICKYNNEETNKNNPISMESLKDEGISGGEIFVLYFGAQIQADTPTELQAIEQKTKIAIDQSELENGEVTRYSYYSVKDKI